MAKTAVAAATSRQDRECISSDVMRSTRRSASTMPPMNVTQPLTPIRVETPGSMPLTEAWKSAAPTLAAHVHPRPTDPYMSAIPLARRNRTAQAEGEAGRG